jgi:hypothetical protein
MPAKLAVVNSIIPSQMILAVNPKANSLQEISIRKSKSGVKFKFRIGIPEAWS